MSENPNPTRCGNCGTMNPPGQEFCVHCHAALTLPAANEALEQTPESAEELRQVEAEVGETQERPVVVMGGIGGAPIPMPTESLDPRADQPPRG